MSGAVELIEAIYRDLDGPKDTWLTGVATAARSAVRGHALGSAHEMRIARDGPLETLGLVIDEAEARIHLEVHRLAPPEIIAAIYLTSPVVSLRQRLEPIAPRELLARALRGVPDHVGCVGMDPRGLGTVLAWAPPRPGVSRAARAVLERVAAHLASATRLRHGNAPTEAVLDRGRLTHAEGDARDARDALVRAARAIDHARSRKASHEEGIAAWNALVEGRWSLVERFDTDGRRFFIAKRNDPGHRAGTGLDATARKVLALVAVGRPHKVIAYELGMSEAAVSSALRRGLRALGVSSRSALVALHGALVGAAQ